MILKALLIIAIVIFGIGVLTYLRPATFSALSGERGIKITSGVAYGSGPRQKLDIYRPPEGVPVQDAIIEFIYGGTWTSGDKSLYGFVGRALAARGFITVIPDYRIYPEAQFPAFFEDAANAYAWIAKNLAPECAPPRPIIVMGHSAGAHMSAMLAYNPAYIQKADPNAPRPAAMIGLAGPYTFEPTTWPTTKDAFASAAATPEKTKPITFVASGAPPSLLLYGLADDIVHLHNLEDLSAALKVKGDAVETETYPGIGHVGLVMALSRPLRWRAPVLDKVVAFASRIKAAQPANAACKSSP